jgi:hypothetical protein
VFSKLLLDHRSNTLPVKIFKEIVAWTNEKKYLGGRTGHTHHAFWAKQTTG